MRDRTKEIKVYSPGRINLIGEHTDYNDGFVLPAAIDSALHFTIGPSKSDKVELHALDLNEKVEISKDNIRKSDKDWVNYCLGILDQLRKRKIRITPFGCSFGGDIPLGAGLSSSAALTCGFSKLIV